MYEIIFYEDKNGRRLFEEYIFTLKEKASTGDKDARINLNKIVAYMDSLEEFGTRVGEPVTKITKKTPKREIKQAIKNLKDYRERYGE